MVWLSIAGGVFLVWLVLVFLFTPAINYHLSQRTSVARQGLPLHHPVHLPGGAAPRQPRDDLHRRSGVLPGDARGDPRRDANDQHGVLHLQAGTDRRAVHRRAERARRAGVRVTIVVDAIGSFAPVGPPGRAAARGRLPRRAVPGGCAGTRSHRLNNRTHRELLVVDGTTSRSSAAPASPTGGPFRSDGKPMWRDMMARIEGPVVAAMQGVAAENWLECCGEILTGPDYFPDLQAVRRDDRVRRQELAVGSRDRVARAVPAADRRGGSDASASARRTSCRTARCAARSSSMARARRRDHRSSCPGGAPISSGCAWPAGGCGASCSRPASASSSTGRHDPRQDADRRRPVGGDRHDEHRQPLVRAQRRGQRRDARRGGGGAAAADYERDLAASDEDHARGWRRRPLWEKIVGPFVWILERQQ